MPRRTIIYLSHGGGPLPLLGDPSHAEMVSMLQTLAAQLPKPESVILISAHWEAPVPTVTAAPAPSLIYDYAGFPPESYRIEYPAPGRPELARRLVDLLQQHGLAAVADPQRGFDHGLFVPMKIMYPQADIPVVQLSLLRGLDPAQHIRLGQVLAELPDEDMFIIGSGFSFHNLRAFFSVATPQAQAENAAFEVWLRETCNSDLDETERRRRLIEWDEAPGARYCHPREEHLIPLHVCYGAAQRSADAIYPCTVMDKQVSTVVWQLSATGTQSA
ncbi:MAG: dioxygenase [Gammaproteobacteria bacterium]|nr:dioxygenase [Gammaproteobacteria bacterium]MDH5650337.1 dioxygenase [Gammaproteobacteria bacterium]